MSLFVHLSSTICLFDSDIVAFSTLKQVTLLSYNTSLSIFVCNFQLYISPFTHYHPFHSSCTLSDLTWYLNTSILPTVSFPCSYTSTLSDSYQPLLLVAMKQTPTMNPSFHPATQLSNLLTLSLSLFIDFNNSKSTSKIVVFI